MSEVVSQELTRVEQKILQFYKNKDASLITAVELVKEFGSDAGRITGLMQKGYVQRQSVSNKTCYVLVGESGAIPASGDAPRKAWKAKPIQENAIDRHLRRWGSCTIEAPLEPWEPGARPIYQMLEGKNRW